MNWLVALQCTTHSLLLCIQLMQLMCGFNLNTPPQTHGRNNHEFVSKVAKSGSNVSFGEDVSHLVKCGQMFEFNVLISHLFSNKMNVNLNVLCLCKMNWVGSKS
jgi:hypothetical protein